MAMPGQSPCCKGYDPLFSVVRMVKNEYVFQPFKGFLCRFRWLTASLEYWLWSYKYRSNFKCVLIYGVVFFLVTLTSLAFDALPELCKEIMHALKDKKELNLIIFT